MIINPRIHNLREIERSTDATLGSGHLPKAWVDALVGVRLKRKYPAPKVLPIQINGGAGEKCVAGQAWANIVSCIRQKPSRRQTEIMPALT